MGPIPHNFRKGKMCQYRWETWEGDGMIPSNTKKTGIFSVSCKLKEKIFFSLIMNYEKFLRISHVNSLTV